MLLQEFTEVGRSQLVEGFVGEKEGFVLDAEMHWEQVALRTGVRCQMLCCGRKTGWLIWRGWMMRTADF